MPSGYQVHWPDRNANFFGRLGYNYYPDHPDTVSIEETLRVLGDLVKKGKVRYIGVSNETPWGLMQYLQLAKKLNFPRIVSIQNPYSLLNRSYEVGLAEYFYREQVGLLAYSPLAFGVLSGKYLDGNRPKGTRLSLAKFSNYTRYFTKTGILATEAYVQLAVKHHLDPAQMALAYINAQPFVLANIIGATKREQLISNIESVNVKLSLQQLKEIDEIHKMYSNPCP